MIREKVGLVNTDGSVGRLINVQAFTATGVYTPSSSLVKKVRVQIVAGGGGGGGAHSTTSSQISVAGGGGGGAFADAFIPIAFASGTNVIIGSGGTGGAATPANGNAGGQSSFGAYIICPGGLAGVGAGIGGGYPFVRKITTESGNPTIALPTGAVLINSLRGERQDASMIFGPSVNQGKGGIGGNSPFGIGADGGGGGINGTPGTAQGYGSGGGGGIEFNSYGGDAGTPGTQGYCLIWEYA